LEENKMKVDFGKNSSVLDLIRMIRCLEAMEIYSGSDYGDSIAVKSSELLKIVYLELGAQIAFTVEDIEIEELENESD